MIHANATTEEVFRFRFTHSRRDDGRLIGLLPLPSDPQHMVYAYQADGQIFERGNEEFHRIFMKLS